MRMLVINIWEWFLSNFIDGLEYPIAFASRILTKTESSYGVTKRAALAVIQGLKWFRSYIYGLNVVVRADHSSLVWLFEKEQTDGMTFRMIQVLQEYQVCIVHQPGLKHGNPDGMSTRDEEKLESAPGEKQQALGEIPQMIESIEEALEIVENPEGVAETRSS